MGLTSYRRAARHAVGMSIGPYGYTLTIWTSGGVLSHARGIPTSIDALLFMLGAVGGFAAVGLAAYGSIHARVHAEGDSPALWGGFHVFAIGAAIGLVTLIAHLLENPGAWPVAGFAATAGYLIVLAAQLAAAT